MKKIGIMSIFYHNWNFGGMLQAYALNRVIREFGYAGEHLYYRLIPSVHKNSPLKDRVRALLAKNVMTSEILEKYRQIRWRDRRDLRNFRLFEKKYVPHGKYCGSNRKIISDAKQYNCIVVGSDQVWSPIFYVDELLRIHGLTFAEKETRKIAYAASIGAENAAIGKEELFREILDNLDYISVREESARAYLQPLTDKPVTVVPDPTLLLDRQKWCEIAVKPAEKAPYLFSYFLIESNNCHDRQIHEIANEMALPMRCIADELGCYPRPNSGDKQILDAGPKEFVGYIRDAEMILTNSFHGMVFSMLFQKPFWVFKRDKDGEKASMNGRVNDFLKDFGLEDRLLADGEMPSAEKLRRPIDYERVNRILEEKRSFSLNWLKNALTNV